MKGEKVDGFDAHHRNPDKGTINFKHALLKRYLPILVGKVGKHAPNSTVHYFDGYAGTGRFSDGTPAGAAHTLRMIDGLKGAHRNFVPTYVEKDPDHFKKLKDLVDEDPKAYDSCTIVEGTAEEHLGAAAKKAFEYPWFVFLDPYGMNVPFETLRRHVLSRPKTVGRQTELLMLYSLEGVRRSAGHLTSPQGHDATVDSVTAFLGTDAWKDIWRRLAGEERDDRMLELYLNKLREHGFIPVAIPMRDTPGGPIIYYFIFCTRSQEGLWAFFDALGWSHEDWCKARGAVVGRPKRVQDSLFAEDNEPVPISFDNDWRPSDEELQEYITNNARQVLDELGAIRPLAHGPRIYGEALGVARSLHILRAIRSLHDDENLLEPRPTSKPQWRKATYSRV